MSRFLLILFCLLMGAAASAVPAGAKDEFLTPQEINDLRDEQDAGKRILLYLSFAQRRLDNIRASSASDSRKAGLEIQKSLDEYNSIFGAIDDSLDQARKQRSMLSKAIQEL